MIDYQEEIEAHNYLEEALEMEKMLNNLTNQNLNSQLNQYFFLTTLPTKKLLE